MSQSHVAAGWYVTGQSFPEFEPAAGRDGPGWASEPGQPERGGVTTVQNLITYRQDCGGQSEHTLVLDSSRARVSGDDNL